MRSDAILHAAIPLLALALLGTAVVRTAWARRGEWLLRLVRAVVLVALACTGAAFLVLGAQTSPPAPLEPFSVAAMCVLVGWLVLRESTEATGEAGHDPSVLRPLAGAAAAIVTGASAAMLALLSRAPAAWLGMLGGPLGHPTIYALCVLGGLFVRYALAGATFLHVGLAACAWLSVASRLAAPDGPFLPAMLLLFVVSARTGPARRRKKALYAERAENRS
jgi:hypothetical protein